MRFGFEGTLRGLRLLGEHGRPRVTVKPAHAVDYTGTEIEQLRRGSVA